MAKTLHSLEELGKAFGIKQKPRREREYKCKVCGADMVHINNVLICTKPHTRTNKHGETEEFEYFVLQKVRRDSGLMAPG